MEARIHVVIPVHLSLAGRYRLASVPFGVAEGQPNPPVPGVSRLSPPYRVVPCQGIFALPRHSLFDSQQGKPLLREPWCQHPSIHFTVVAGTCPSTESTEFSAKKSRTEYQWSGSFLLYEVRVAKQGGSPPNIAPLGITCQLYRASSARSLVPRYGVLRTITTTPLLHCEVPPTEYGVLCPEGRVLRSPL